MARLHVTGAPSAPADKTLSITDPLSTLTVTLLDVYQDGTYNHAPVHQAAYDVTHNSWKPLGTADGTDWYLPGQANTEPAPPYAKFVETQVYTDGSTQTKTWKQKIISTDGTTWSYATPG